MKKEELYELLYQAPQTEMAGFEIHETAVSLAHNASRRKEWQEYLDETRRARERDVKTAIGAARAKQARTEML